MNHRRLIEIMAAAIVLLFGACAGVDHGEDVVEFNLNYSIGKDLSDSKFGKFVKNMPHFQVDSKTYGVEGGFKNGCQFYMFVNIETDIVVGWKYTNELTKKKCDEIEGHAGGQ